MDSLSPFLWDSFIPNYLPVNPGALAIRPPGLKERLSKLILFGAGRVAPSQFSTLPCSLPPFTQRSSGHTIPRTARRSNITSLLREYFHLTGSAPAPVVTRDTAQSFVLPSRTQLSAHASAIRKHFRPHQLCWKTSSRVFKSLSGIALKRDSA